MNYTTAVKNARLDATAGEIDAHASAGVLQLGTTGMGTVLAEMTLNKPCASNASGLSLLHTLICRRIESVTTR